MSFPTTIYGHLADRLTQTTDQKHPLGTRMVLPDGRVFRYARAGAVTLAIGKLMQESVVLTDHGVDMTATAADIGDKKVTAYLLTTAIDPNEYKEGYLFIDSGAGAGQVCTIKSHPAGTASADCEFTLEDEDALTVALTTASDIGLRLNPYDGVLVMPTSLTGIPVGVTPIAVTTPNYFWLQTWGPAAVLTAGDVLVGNNVVPLTTVGAVGPSTSHLLPVVGTVMSVASSTEYSLVFLTIAP